MKPPRFAYHAPRSVEEVLALLSEHGGDAKVLAGGQSLMPLLNFRMVTPEHLIDINRLPDLGDPVRTAGGWRIPALVRQRGVERHVDLGRTHPLLGQALRFVAHPQIRNRGTICGSLAHADPSAEMPAVMTALDARMLVVSSQGERTVAAADFITFHLTSDLAEDELLLGVEIDDLAPGTRTAFTEFATRHGDFGLASVAALVTPATGDAPAVCRLVASGVSATPLRLRAAEEIVTASGLDPASLRRVQDAVADEVSPTGDVHASADYRRQLVATLTRRALEVVNASPGTADAITEGAAA